MKRLLAYWKLHFADPKLKLSFLLTLAVLFGLLIFSGPKEKNTKPEETLTTSDEYIPDGHVLVPLELQNRESLHALVGAYAIVDLFTLSPDGKSKGVRVGRRLKLVRSPLQPDQFAVLVHEDKAGLILNPLGPLFAVIQSRQTKKNATLIEKQKTHSRIRTLEGDRK